MLPAFSIGADMATDPELLAIQAHYYLQLGQTAQQAAAKLQTLHVDATIPELLNAIVRGQEMLQALPQPFLPPPEKPLQDIAPWVADKGQSTIQSRIGVTLDNGETFNFPFQVQIDPSGMTAGQLEDEILSKLEEARSKPADGHTIGGVLYTVLSLIESIS